MIFNQISREYYRILTRKQLTSTGNLGPKLWVSCTRLGTSAMQQFGKKNIVLQIKSQFLPIIYKNQVLCIQKGVFYQQEMCNKSENAGFKFRNCAPALLKQREKTLQIHLSIYLVLLPNIICTIGRSVAKYPELFQIILLWNDPCGCSCWQKLLVTQFVGNNSRLFWKSNYHLRIIPKMLRKFYSKQNIN